MKLRFTRSETNPNHYLKVVDDRPLIPAPYKDDLFLTGADPLICRSKRELDSRCGMINCKPLTTSRILTFRSYIRPDLGNASEFQKKKLIRVDVLGEPPSEHMFCS